MGELSEIVSRLDKFEEQEKERKRKEREAREQKIKDQLEPGNLSDDSSDENDVVEGEEEEQDKKNRSKCLVIKEYVTPKFNLKEPNPNVKGAIGKFRKRMGQYLAFIDCFKHLRSSEYCSVLQIATTSKRFKDIFGTERSVSGAIDALEEMGVVEEFIDFFTSGWAKTYKYYYENEKELIKYCKEHKIPKFIVKNTINFTNKEKEEIEDVLDNKVEKGFKDKVLFKSRLKLKRPENVRPGKFKQALIECLYENYPGFKYYQELADEINEKYYVGADDENENDENLKIKFKPTFHWNSPKRNDKGEIIKGSQMQYINGIGIRVANHYSNAKKDNYVSDEDKRKTRDEVLKDFGFVFEKDIKSSVPRVTYALNGGGWIKNEIDFYKKIYDVYDPDGDDFDIERAAIKKLFFRTYFDTTDKKLGYHTWRNMIQDGMDKGFVYEKMAKLKEAMEKVLGTEGFDNYVFYAESCIYLEALYLLLRKGYKVWIVFDCFYGKGFGTQEEFERYVLDAVFISYMRFKMASDFNDWSILKKVE